MALTNPQLFKRVALGFGAVGILALVIALVLVDDPAKQTRERYQAAMPKREKVEAIKRPPSGEGLVQPPAIYPDGETAPPPEITSLPQRPGFANEDKDSETVTSLRKDEFPPAPPVPETLLHPRFPTREAPGPTAPEIRIAPQRYLFNNLSEEAMQAQPLALAKAGSNPTVKGKFAPQGECIQLALLDSVVSNRREIDVAAGVWEPLYFGGSKLLEVGDKLLGRAAPGKFRGRLEIIFHKVILKDGRSIPMHAIAQDPDGSMGVKGRQVGSTALHSIAPILLDMASAFSNSFKNRVLVGAGSSAYGYSTAAGGMQDVPDLRNAAITGSQGGISKIQSILAGEIEENRPYLIVPAGTRCRAFLTQLLDVSIADYGK